MGTFLLISAAIVIGALAMPLGLLPSIFLFRDLANGTDASEASKRRYAAVLWGSLAASWLAGCLVAYIILGKLLS